MDPITVAQDRSYAVGILDFPDEDFDSDFSVEVSDLVDEDYEEDASEDSDEGDEVEVLEEWDSGPDLEGNPHEVNKYSPNDVPFKPVDTLPEVITQGYGTTSGNVGDGGSASKDSSDSKWVNSIRERRLVQPGRLTTLSSSKSCSIHRVPHCIRRHNETAYDPQIISIGPFHYKKRESQLKSMEEHKWRYLHDILKDHEERDLLEPCLLAIRKLEKKARDCYSEKVDLDSNPFVEMLLLDGFFIIEFFCRSKNKEYRDDPILKLGWLKSAIKMDLLLLENQIPFFVLESLCKEMGPQYDDFLTKRVRPFFFPSNDNAPSSNQQEEKDKGTKFQHLLHYVHCIHLPNSPKKKTEKDDPTRFHLRRFMPCLHLPTSVDEKPTGRKLQIIPNASRLQVAGIKFGEGRPGSDIKFEKGVIKIPPLKVKDATKSVLLNLVAFEQCYRHCNSYFAGYTYFMDCLIDNAKDVQILCENEIINRWLSSDKEVAALFNKMGREIIVYDHDSNLLDVCEEINRYYRASWNAWRTSLKRNYFNNPWAIISVAAGIVLLLFTFSQTFFSAFPKFAAGN